MSTQIRMLAAVVAVAAFGAVVLVLQPWSFALGKEPEVQQEAEVILRQVAADYTSATDYSGTLAVTQRVVRDAGTTTHTVNVTFRLMRPNKLHARLEVDGTEWLFVCDGRTYWTYFPATGKYLAEDAPATLEELSSDGHLARMLLGMRPVTFGLFDRDPYATLTADAESVEFVGSEQLAQEPVNHVVLHTGRGSMDLWVTREEPRIVRARLNPWKLVAEAIARQPDLKEVVIEMRYERDGPELPEGAFAFEPPEGARRAENLPALLDLTGAQMRDFTLEGLAEGTTWHLADHKGKVIILDFWASWCGPCRAELPELQKIYNDYKHRDFLLLAVNVGEGREKAAAFLEQMRLDVPVALDTQGAVFGSYSATSLPTLLLIGKDGTIEAVHVGYAPGVERTIRREIDRLLAGESLLEQ